MTDKDTLRRTSARKAAERLRKTADGDKHLSLARRTEDFPLQGSALQEGEVGAIGERESQEDRTSKTQSKEIKIEEPEVKWNMTSEAPNATGAISSDRPTREHKAPSPLLPQTLRHIKLRRRLGQNKAFLPALKRALIKARRRLTTHCQNLK